MHGPCDGRQQLRGLVLSFFSRHPPLATRERTSQATTMHQFQSHERAAIRRLVKAANFVDLHDAGVLELGHRLGLDAEARERRRIDVAFGANQFERDKSLQPRLTGLIDNTHAASAEFSQNLVPGDDRPAQRFSRSSAGRWFADRRNVAPEGQVRF